VRLEHYLKLSCQQNKYTSYVADKIKLCPRGAQTCVLPLFCDRDLEIKPMTLKLEGDVDILKIYLHTRNEAVILRDSKPKAWIQKIRKYVSRSKCQKFWITSSIIIRYILIKSQQLLTSSFWVAHYHFCTAVTLTLDPRPWNWTRYSEDVSPHQKWSC